MRIAFATCSAMPDGWDDDHDAAELLNADFQVWDDPAVDWSVYDRVLLRSVWDYTERLAEFLDWCQSIGPSRLRNPPAMVAFSADKRYLAELSARCAPTLYLPPGESLPNIDGEIVIKPNISAGARDTGRFASPAAAADLITEIHRSGRTALIQPYLPTVDERGETSVVFIGGAFSHALTKRAILRDHGVAPVTDGKLHVATAMLEEDFVLPGTVNPAEMSLAISAHNDVAARFGVPTYARVDLVVDLEGQPALSELELIEPNLYLRLASGAPERLATSVRVS
jgi:hypothetical protein